MLLRQTRIVLAAANLSDALWPFAVKFVALAHRSLPSLAVSCYQPDQKFAMLAGMGQLSDSGR